MTIDGGLRSGVIITMCSDRFSWRGAFCNPRVVRRCAGETRPDRVARSCCAHLIRGELGLDAASRFHVGAEHRVVLLEKLVDGSGEVDGARTQYELGISSAWRVTPEFADRIGSVCSLATTEFTDERRQDSPT